MESKCGGSRSEIETRRDEKNLIKLLKKRQLFNLKSDLFQNVCFEILPVELILIQNLTCCKNFNSMFDLLYFLQFEI